MVLSVYIDNRGTAVHANFERIMPVATRGLKPGQVAESAAGTIARETAKLHRKEEGETNNCFTSDEADYEDDETRIEDDS